MTAHLGGGVGKVLSRLVEASARRADGIHHVIACLEKPEKNQFTAHVSRFGGELLVEPPAPLLAERLAAADIVQLEWWHHPAVSAWLCSDELPPMRLVVWSHVSGLVPPQPPARFMALPHRFLFSSPCSLNHPAIGELPADARRRLGVVFSSGGFDDLPEVPIRDLARPLRVGYVGTLNFAKLNPDLLSFLSAVTLPDFRLILFGDPTTAGELREQARQANLEDRLVFAGYTSDIAGVLADLDVLAYLLNPDHYGTTENALLEAMAMGVVPIVLDNPAERILVDDGRTGLVIEDPQGFADALARLAHRPDVRQALARNAAKEVRSRFAVERTSNALMEHYDSVLTEDKARFDFRPVLGTSPADWFLSCQGRETWRFEAPSGQPSDAVRPAPRCLFEKTKSSVFHYRDSFPRDVRLQHWADALEAWR